PASIACPPACFERKSPGSAAPARQSIPGCTRRWHITTAIVPCWPRVPHPPVQPRSAIRARGTATREFRRARSILEGAFRRSSLGLGTRGRRRTHPRPPQSTQGPHASAELFGRVRRFQRPARSWLHSQGTPTQPASAPARVGVPSGADTPKQADEPAVVVREHVHLAPSRC